jgi:hypothetical protein
VRQQKSISCSDTMTVTGRCPSFFRCRCSVTRSVVVIRIVTLCETPLHFRNAVSETPFHAPKRRFIGHFVVHDSWFSQ